jgi:hypothetical protein
LRRIRWNAPLHLRNHGFGKRVASFRPEALTDPAGPSQKDVTVAATASP